VTPFSLRELLGAAPDAHELHGRTINPLFVRILRILGFDRDWVRGEGAYL